MNARVQKQGKQHAWKLEELSEGLTDFYNKHNRYPTAREVDAHPYLPSSRSIQRRFGGLVNLRKELKLDSPKDFTKGVHSSKRAKDINKRAHIIENEVYKTLLGKFGRMFVHREFFFTDDRRNRLDFFVYCKNGDFGVDVFYPKDRFNLVGCINSKLKTYSDSTMIQYPVIFLMMNKDIEGDQILKIIGDKKKKLHAYHSIMTYDQFIEFCKNKKPMGK